MSDAGRQQPDPPVREWASAFREMLLCFLAADVVLAFVRYFLLFASAGESVAGFLLGACMSVLLAGFWSGIGAMAESKKRRCSRDRTDAG